MKFYQKKLQLEKKRVKDIRNEHMTIFLEGLKPNRENFHGWYIFSSKKR